MISTHLNNESNWIISPGRSKNKTCFKPPPSLQRRHQSWLKLVFRCPKWPYHLWVCLAMMAWKTVPTFLLPNGAKTVGVLEHFFPNSPTTLPRRTPGRISGNNCSCRCWCHLEPKIMILKHHGCWAEMVIRWWSMFILLMGRNFKKSTK